MCITKSAVIAQKSKRAKGALVWFVGLLTSDPLTSDPVHSFYKTKKNKLPDACDVD